jgi:hypothetical protein
MFWQFAGPHGGLSYCCCHLPHVLLQAGVTAADCQAQHNLGCLTIHVTSSFLTLCACTGAGRRGAARMLPQVLLLKD